MNMIINRRSALASLGAITILVGQEQSRSSEIRQMPQEVAPTLPMEDSMNMINRKSQFHSDAALLALGDELEEAHKRMEEASHVFSAAERRYLDLLPPRPAREAQPAEFNGLLSKMTIAELAAMPPEHPFAAWHQQSAATYAKREKAWRQKRARLARQTGSRAAEKAFNGWLDEMREIGERIFATPAKTVDGMRVKLCAHERLGLRDFVEDGDAFMSIAKDIEYMAGMTVVERAAA